MILNPPSCKLHYMKKFVSFLPLCVRMKNETDSNNSYGVYNYQEHFKKTQLIPYCIIMIVGFLGNSIIIVNGIRRRHAIRHYSFHFVLSLAFADLGVCAVTIPIEIYEEMVRPLKHTHFTCTYVMQIPQTFQGATIFSVTLLAVTRLCQIKFFPTRQFSRTLCVALISGLWITCFCIFTVPTFFIYETTPNGFCEPVYKNETFRDVFVTVIISMMIIPILFATIAYVYIIVKIRHTITPGCQNASTHRNRKMTILLILLILSCWVSYTPNVVFLILIRLHTMVDFNPLYAWSTASTFFYGGSAVNPVLILLTMPTEYGFSIHFVRRQREPIHPCKAFMEQPPNNTREGVLESAAMRPCSSASDSLPSTKQENPIICLAPIQEH